MSAPAASLAGLRVLVTRPQGRADDLQRAIVAAGGSVEHVPMLAIEPLDALRDAAQWRATEDKLRHVARYRRVIAISVNAVHYGVPWLQSQAAGIADGIVWYGIGAATAAEFARFGIAAHGGGAGATSEALLALPDLQNVRGETILILRGIGGRETLAGALRERGAEVEYAECYRRAAPRFDEAARALLRRAGFDALCVNSAETLQHLADAIRAVATWDDYRGVPLLVPSERVARQAVELGFERPLVAADAGTPATVAALSQLATSR
jgi:uroporphyrinogen-III synthase